MGKPKIAIIGLKGLPAFGGAAAVGQALIEKLKKEYEFYVYSLSTHTVKSGYQDGYYQIIFKEKNVNSMTALKYYIKSMLHCLLLSHYDLIHLHHSASGFIIPFIKLRYRVIVTFHGIFANKKDPKFNKYINILFKISEKIAILMANKIISVSEYDKKYCENKYLRQIEYIPNGVYKEKINHCSKEIEYLFVAARIYEIKGLHILLKTLKECNIPGKLIVIGDINQNLKYKADILKYSENMNVNYIPLIRDKRQLFMYIRKAKLFIFPSLFEAMSMMLLEVASLNTPILASDIEANRNIFNDNEVTYFNVNDYKDLGNKILYCKSNESEILDKAHRAYIKLNKKYSWYQISQQYAKLYKELT